MSIPSLQQKALVLSPALGFHPLVHNEERVARLPWQEGRKGPCGTSPLDSQCVQKCKLLQFIVFASALITAVYHPRGWQGCFCSQGP